MICIEYKNICGIQIYLDEDYGLLVTPQALLSLPSESASELAVWCGKHNTEASVIMAVRGHSARGAIDHNFPDWMVEVIANGELADMELRQLAKKELKWRQNGMWPPRLHNMSKSVDDTAPGYVYLLKAGPWYKIGKTVSLHDRFTQLVTQLPFAIELTGYIRTTSMTACESKYHKQFSEKRLNGEWFSLTDDDVKVFLQEASENDDDARPAAL